MTYTREDVLKMLNAYTENMRKIALLRYELEHPAHISPDEMIEAMAFAQGDGSGTPSNHISNKTLYIALNYRESAEQANSDTMDEIACRLFPLERERDRLHHYVALLDERMARIIRLCYFEKLPLEEVCAKMKVSTKTLRKQRVEAVDALAAMYEFAMGKSK